MERRKKARPIKFVSETALGLYWDPEPLLFDLRAFLALVEWNVNDASIMIHSIEVARKKSRYEPGFSERCINPACGVVKALFYGYG